MKLYSKGECLDVKITDVAENDLYNPYESMYKKGLNTAGYRDNINLFAFADDTNVIASNAKLVVKHFRTFAAQFSKFSNNQVLNFSLPLKLPLVVVCALFICLSFVQGDVIDYDFKYFSRQIKRFVRLPFN